MLKNKTIKIFHSLKEFVVWFSNTNEINWWQYLCTNVLNKIQTHVRITIVSHLTTKINGRKRIFVNYVKMIRNHFIDRRKKKHFHHLNMTIKSENYKKHQRMGEWVQGSVKKCECTLRQIYDESSCQLNRHLAVTYIFDKSFLIFNINKNSFFQLL